ncbi:hypothetical protein H072_2045 [Dactylellina haptotyla CBS 200.50]|uniref:Mid2 domain-containing protein n=1 Tax=Dactylellina haptotyla (strain CBS 200.50) TaxID=1284197 RepID=S8BWV8_DACHA|nr:hypothetical protein H072_2045 [Dactylellina haptotyla CBS 200.50]
MAQQDIAVHVTAAPRQLPHGGRIPFGDGLVKRQQLTFSSCGLACAADDFCQGYRSNFGFCCPTSVLTRTAFNYCGPATTCIEYGVTSVSDFFYDSTRSIQYCGAARPSCATYVYTNDDYTQVFCAADQSGVYSFDTTSTAGQSATFVGRTSSTSPETSPPTASVVSRTSPADSTTASFTGTNTNTNAAATTTGSGGSGGLGTGAIAGIAVGAAIIGIALAIGAFFLWRRSNKKKDSGVNQQFPPPPPPMNQQQGVGGPYDPNAGYYQQQQPYSPLPQNQLPQDQGYYKANYPQGQNQAPVFELGGGGAHIPPPTSPGPAPMYQETTEPMGAHRQELQG